ncbi:MAG: T9SS type A sorting domain-containing protein [Flavobacteriaceae bacterium]
MKNYYLLIVSLITFNLTMAQTDFFPVYDGIFDGTVYAQTFTFPTGAQDWAGFANNNTSIYPLSYPNGGQVSFKATVAVDAEVYFRFEANPWPDVNPAIVTANVLLLASNPAETVYTVDIPADASNTYNSALMYVVTRDVDVVSSEIKLIQFDTDGTTELSVASPVYDGTFDGTAYAQTFTFPTGAQDWAGFANNNTGIYPLTFPDAGTVSFKATVSADAEVYFRFEANPWPDVNPAIVTANVLLLASNPAETVYTVDIPADASNTYNSALMYVVTRDVEVSMLETKITQNASTASVDDLTANSVKMYPNPAKGVVNFTSALNADLDVAVYDLLGKEVLRANAVQSQLNISSLNPGMYFVNMTQGTTVSTKKLVVR